MATKKQTKQEKLVLRKLEAVAKMDDQSAAEELNKFLSLLEDKSHAGGDPEESSRGAGTAKSVSGKSFKLKENVKIQNSARTWTYKVACVYYPQSLRGTAEAIQDCQERGLKIKGLASRHSYSRVIQTPGAYIDMCESYKKEWFGQRVLGNLKIETNDKYVNVPGGMGIKEINERLGSDKKGAELFLKGNPRRLFNMGGADLQTFAGAFSNGTHGSGGAISTYHDMVRSIVLVASGGRIFRIEPKDGITDPKKHKEFHKVANVPDVTLIQEDDAFYSVLVSMGCMGMIYSCIIETEPQSIFHEEVFYYEPSEDTKKKKRTSRKFDADLAKSLKEIPTMRERIKTRFPKEILPKENQHAYYYLYINPYKARKNKKDVVKKKDAIFGHSITEKLIISDCNEKPIKRAKRRNFWPFSFAGLNISAALVRFIANQNITSARTTVETALHNLDDNFSHKGGGCTDISYKIWNTGAGKVRTFGLGVEVAFPTEMIPDVLAILLPKLELLGRKNRHYLNAPIALRFVKPSEAYLAPNYKFRKVNGKLVEVKEWCYIEMLRISAKDPIARAAEVDLYHDLQEMLHIGFGGRIHWGLNFAFQFTADRLHAMYPKFDEWTQQFHRFNPDGFFDNKFTSLAGMRTVADEMHALGKVQRLPV